MSAYLKFFELSQSPFDTGSQSSLVLGTQALRDAFGQIEAGLAEEAPRICVNGSAGLGKTSLARALPKLLRDQARVVLLLNPSLPWATLRAALVKQLDLEGGVLSRQSLHGARSAGKRLVVVIDAAETIDRESLEHLDILLAYRTDDDQQLVHCVLLANLEHAREQDDCPLLWWLDSLNTLQLEFAPIPVAGVRSYIVKHLKRAGWSGGELFSVEAARAIHRITGGVPRSVSELCERVLAEAAERGASQIDADLVEEVSGERPPSQAEPEEVVLDQVLDPAADEASAEPAERGPEANVGVAATGLDAFFGPSSEAAEETRAPSAPTARPTEEAPAFAEDQEMGAPGFAELDVESRGGFLRWTVIGGLALALIGAGVFAGGFLSGDPDPEPALDATPRAPSPPADRVRAAAKSGESAETDANAPDEAEDVTPEAAIARRDFPKPVNMGRLVISGSPPTLQVVAEDKPATSPAAPAAAGYADEDERHF